MSDRLTKIEEFFSKIKIGTKFATRELQEKLDQYGVSSFQPTDYCYNSYCINSQWDKQRTFFLEKIQNSKYIVIGKNSETYSNVVICSSINKDKDGIVYGKWQNGEFYEYDENLSVSVILTKYLEEFSKVADKEMDSHKECFKSYDFFNNFLLKEKIDSYVWEDFQKIGDNLNTLKCNNQTKKRAFGRPNHEIEEYKRKFKSLLDDSKPLEERVKNFLKDNFKYLDTAITELIGYRFLENYIIRNSITDIALNYIGINTKKNYIDLNSYLKDEVKIQELYEKIVGRKKQDYPINLEIDRFFYWIVTNNPPILSKDLISKKSVNIKEQKKNEEEMPQQPKNQILYGPPGTGKTYNTVVEAMRIIEPENFDEDGELKGEYKDLKEKFYEYKKQGRIEFVTFHQSYSYEEFVEGIKPILNSDEISYIRKEGIFKQISKTAIEKQINKEQFNFVFENLSVYKLWLPDRDGIYDYCLQNSCVVLDWGEEYDVSSCFKREDIEEIVPISHPDRFTIVSHLNLFKLWIDNDLNNDKDVIIIVPGSRYSIKAIAHITKENGEYKYNPEFEYGHHRRNVKWLKTNINISSNNIYDSCFVPPTLSGMYTEKLQKHKDALMELLNNTDNSKIKNCVLIIDEINRGNISKIFGELITLIEEDKRLGEANEVTVKLPYAEEGEPAFGVPSNLYIIGTMNTSDRSIASVDIALRRRFKFKEMMPESDKVADFDCNFKGVFELLNKRISVLLDRDHQIGHSYFIKDKYENAGVIELKDIWFDSILPLLNEYFYGDWEKLQKLLGCAKEKDDDTAFIKKLDIVKFADETTLDDEQNCFDFTDKEGIDFEAAMEHAFKDVFKIEEKNG